MGFLSLCNIGSKERHKSTTRNYVPWGVYTGCSRDTVLFLCLLFQCNISCYEITTRNSIPQGAWY